ELEQVAPNVPHVIWALVPKLHLGTHLSPKLRFQSRVARLARERLQQGRAERSLALFPPQFGIKINLFGLHLEAYGPQQIRDALLALHRLSQTSREQLNVFLVRIE